MITVIVIFFSFLLFVGYCIIAMAGNKSPEEKAIDDEEQWQWVSEQNRKRKKI